LSYLPQNASESPLRAPEKSRRASNLRIEIPEAQTRAYDMRNFILSLADADSLMEMQREFAPNTTLYFGV
jgi:acetyl-CoA carboxylase carboxyltransferase component